VNRLSKKEESKYPFYKCKRLENKGWSELVEQMCISILPELEEDLQIVDIRAVRGSMRVTCLGYPSKKILDIIEKAEQDSLTVCEYCGKPAKLIQKGNTFKVLCNSCKKEYNRKKYCRVPELNCNRICVGVNIDDLNLSPRLSKCEYFKLKKVILFGIEISTSYMELRKQ